jgi:hypothetical protein
MAQDALLERLLANRLVRQAVSEDLETASGS